LFTYRPTRLYYSITRGDSGAAKWQDPYILGTDPKVPVTASLALQMQDVLPRALIAK